MNIVQFLRMLIDKLQRKADHSNKNVLVLRQHFIEGLNPLNSNDKKVRNAEILFEDGHMLQYYDLRKVADSYSRMAVRVSNLKKLDEDTANSNYYYLDTYNILGELADTFYNEVINMYDQEGDVVPMCIDVDADLEEDGKRAYFLFDFVYSESTGRLSVYYEYKGIY